MQFSLTDDQRMIADSLRGYLARPRAATDVAFDRSLWHELADLGMLGATLPAEFGGFDGGGRELEVIAAELGRARCATPYIATVATFATMVLQGCSDALKSDILPRIATGELTGSLAWQERRSRYSIDHIETTARSDGDGWVVNGRKAQVLYGGCVDTLLVTTLAGDELAVFLIEAGAPGVTISPLALVDGQPGADITFDEVRLGPGAKLAGGAALVRAGLNWGSVAACAEAVAEMEELLRMTVDYIGVRIQFGRPIGRNQVLQHRCADMLLQLEKARSMALLAAVSLSGPAAECNRAVAQASLIVGIASRYVGEQAIQLHGGIGMTAESEVAKHVKRMFLNRVLFGDADEQLDRIDQARRGAAA